MRHLQDYKGYSWKSDLLILLVCSRYPAIKIPIADNLSSVSTWESWNQRLSCYHVLPDLTSDQSACRASPEGNPREGHYSFSFNKCWKVGLNTAGVDPYFGNPFCHWRIILPKNTPVTHGSHFILQRKSSVTLVHNSPAGSIEFATQWDSP